MNGVRVVPKPWGHEKIFAANELYAGKILRIEPGQALSYQYHTRKDETIYVLSGDLTFEFEEVGGSRQTRVLEPGEAVRIVPGTRHRMAAGASPCEILEVSSPELDDVVRLEDRYGRRGTSAP